MYGTIPVDYVNINFKHGGEEIGEIEYYINPHTDKKMNSKCIVLFEECNYDGKY